MWATVFKNGGSKQTAEEVEELEKLILGPELCKKQEEVSWAQVESFLEELKLGFCASALQERGFDSLERLATAEMEDLTTGNNAIKVGHARQIQKALLQTRWLPNDAGESSMQHSISTRLFNQTALGLQSVQARAAQKQQQQQPKLQADQQQQHNLQAGQQQQPPNFQAGSSPDDSLSSNASETPSPAALSKSDFKQELPDNSTQQQLNNEGDYMRFDKFETQKEERMLVGSLQDLCGSSSFWNNVAKEMDKNSLKRVGVTTAKKASSSSSSVSATAKGVAHTNQKGPTSKQLRGGLYVGQMENGAAHGKGRWTCGKEEYDGEFKNDDLEGYGEFKYSSGATYFGHWKAGKKKWMG
eukprot:gb/GEZN01003754.1/.p2 GENE.gb/GEZN01003754.1/~~gb/GEZN01003754.1/.p2  ORF type:complete len:356 (-),score=98.52 gb/GEZN01003754.1/:930-1997(-)